MTTPYQEKPGFIGPRLPYHPKGGFDGPQKEDYGPGLGFLWARMAWTMKFMTPEEIARANYEASGAGAAARMREVYAKALNDPARKGTGWSKGLDE